MKKFIQWLANVFNANITVIKTVEKEVEVVKEVPYYLPKDGTIDGDITIKGNVVVNGYLHVKGSLACKEMFND